MTNGAALVLGALVVAAILLDLAMGWGATLFIARKLLDLIAWVAFWR